MKQTWSRIIPGLLGWIGGDSAVFTAGELAKLLNIPEEEINQVFNMLVRGRFIEKTGTLHFSVTKLGSYLIDYSLLSIIGCWALESELYSKYPYHTLQWLYTVHVPFPSLKLPYGMKSTYIFDFSQRFMKTVANLIPGYTVNEYPALRDFVVKLSLHPTYLFLSSDSPKVIELVKKLLDLRVAKLQASESSDSFLVFDSTKLRELIDGYRKVEKTHPRDT